MEEPTGLPDYIEVEPDRRKPFALCTREELCAHAVRLMDRAVWEARDAAETAELDGGQTPLTEELTHQSSEHLEQANTLIAFLTGSVQNESP